MGFSTFEKHTCLYLCKDRPVCTVCSYVWLTFYYCLEQVIHVTLVWRLVFLCGKHSVAIIRL